MLMKETKQMDRQEERPNKREIPLEKLIKRAFLFSFLDDDDDVLLVCLSLTSPPESRFPRAAKAKYSVHHKFVDNKFVIKQDEKQ